MRHAAGEPADRFHLLRLPQLLFEPAPLGDVARVDHDAGDRGVGEAVVRFMNSAQIGNATRAPLDSAWPRRRRNRPRRRRRPCEVNPTNHASRCRPSVPSSADRTGDAQLSRRAPVPFSTTSRSIDIIWKATGSVRRDAGARRAVGPAPVRVEDRDDRPRGRTTSPAPGKIAGGRGQVEGETSPVPSAREGTSGRLSRRPASLTARRKDLTAADPLLERRRRGVVGVRQRDAQGERTAVACRRAPRCLGRHSGSSGADVIRSR